MMDVSHANWYHFLNYNRRALISEIIDDACLKNKPKEVLHKLFNIVQTQIFSALLFYLKMSLVLS